jgi:hypothetical protein
LTLELQWQMIDNRIRAHKSVALRAI